MFWGSITALITPFKNDQINFKGLEAHITHQMNAGTHGLVPVGTTGEAPTLSFEEHRDIIQLTVDLAKNKLPIISGTGSSCTRTCLKLSQSAQETGSDALLFTPPAYNKPNQEGIYEHFKTIHDNTDLPIVLYSNPARTVCDFTFETIQKLSQLERIVSIKDASGDMLRLLEMKLKLKSNFSFLTGDDNGMFGFLAQGGVGCISVISNVIPKHCADLQEAWKANDMKAFEKIRKDITPLLKAISQDTNPITIKYAVSLLGYCDDMPRLPMTPLADEFKQPIKVALEDLGVI